jgi:hypothetical protein
METKSPPPFLPRLLHASWILAISLRMDAVEIFVRVEWKGWALFPAPRTHGAAEILLRWFPCIFLGGFIVALLDHLAQWSRSQMHLKILLRAKKPP